MRKAHPGTPATRSPGGFARLTALALLALVVAVPTGCATDDDSPGTGAAMGGTGSGAGGGGAGTPDAGDGAGTRDGGRDAALAVDPDDGVPPDPAQYDAPAIYRDQCENCHGPHGEGGAGPALTRSYQVGYLAEYIDARMPLGNPERCDAGCSAALAEYILSDLLAAPPPDCATDSPSSAPRALRLLTRREYRNTVRDLLRLGGASSGPAGGAACEALADCDAARASCVDAVCIDDACEVHTFLFDAASAGRAPTTVHVAGSFNGWPGTVAAGGWPLTYDAALQRWVLKHVIPDGDHSYKLVIDEREWLPDPGNPDRAPDGFGGENSVLRQACAGAAPGGSGAGVDENALAVELAALTRDLPPETRPRGFGFEAHASAGLGTPTHVEASLVAAQSVAAKVKAQPARFAPCLGAADCPEQFLGDFGRRAFRRPLTPDEISRYATLWRAQPTDADGLDATVSALLVSPGFLYRSELGEETSPGVFRLTPWETAGALSYAFWATMPDDALFEAAATGGLDTPIGIAAQAERLLADPRAREQIGAFALQWLGVEGLSTREKRPDLFPTWSPALAESMLEETRRFVVAAVFEDDARFASLLTGTHTFVDARLAALYGLAGDYGATFERADVSGLAGGARAGVLGHASMLATTAHSDQTSPIRRGLFVRERLLCTVFGTPPADAGGVPDVDPQATTRERFRQHTAEERCAACHRYIDDLGFGFEQFDAVGAFRETEAGRPIDHRGNLNDVEGLGTGTDGPYETLPALGALLAESERAEACFATQVWRFHRGRLEAPADTCELEEVQATFRASGGDVRALLVALTQTPAFSTRRDAE
jgi:mono/diheme cytochrome c family protein